MLNKINEIIAEIVGREYQIGQSYFMEEGLDNRALKRVLSYEIIPLLEQYFFGKKERLEQLRQICNRALTSLSRE